MITMSINDAASKYSGTTLKEVIENMIHPGEFYKIWLYANASGGNRTHTDFLCVSRSDNVQQVVRFLMSRDVANDTRIYYEGKLEAALDAEYFNKPIVSKMSVETPAQDVDTLDVTAKQAALIVPEWYFAKSDSKHVNQVAITLPPQAEIPPRVGNLVAGGGFMQANWAATALFMPGITLEAQGPIVFAKASGIIEMLKGHPASVAFAFYRLGRGGIFQIFVQVDTPQIRAKAKNSPFLTEHSRWLDEEEDCRLIEALISREKLEVCFVAPGNNGPCTGYFGLQVGLPQALKDILRQEWKDLLAYHKGVSNRNYQAALDQYNRENPIESPPVLPSPKVESRKAESQKPKVQKKWWEFWK